MHDLLGHYNISNQADHGTAVITRMTTDHRITTPPERVTTFHRHVNGHIQDLAGAVAPCRSHGRHRHFSGSTATTTPRRGQSRGRAPGIRGNARNNLAWPPSVASCIAACGRGFHP
jgi:hypothetical protein